MEDSPVSAEQRARLLELEARQQQLKRLCEEALKEDEEHQHIFQQLEEHNMTSSTAGSFRGVGSGTATAPPARPAAAADDLMDDLMTGEVRSFRDPNSITRASSTGSVGGAAGQTGFAPYARRASVDRPTMTRLDSAYRPPTYPTPPDSGESSSGPLPPPPPPRATLYASTRQPRHAAPTSTALHPPDPFLSAAAASSAVPPPWRRSGGADAAEAPPAAAAAAASRPALSSPYAGTAASPRAASSYAASPKNTTAPLSSPSDNKMRPPPPPPPLPTERSRSLSHSVPLNDRFQRSGDYHVHAAPPPPPPPPRLSTSPTQAQPSPHSVTYTRARVGLTSPSAATQPPPPPPPPPQAHTTIVSPDEVSDKLPPPPPSRTRGLHTTPESRTGLTEKYRSPFLYSSPHARSSMPPPPPPPPPARVLTSPSAASGLPPPPPQEPSDATRDRDSLLSTTSTDIDIARWRHQLRYADTALRSSPKRARNRTAGGSWAEMQSRTAATTQRGLQRQFDAAAAATASSLDGSRRGRVAPPPPPPPPPPLEDDSDNTRFSRWDAVPLSPSSKRAEGTHLRRYFASDTRPAPRSLDDYLHAGTATSPRSWRSTGQQRGQREQQQDDALHRRRYTPSATTADWSLRSDTRGAAAAAATDRTATALHYDTSTADESYETAMFHGAPLSSPPLPPPPPHVPQWPPRDEAGVAHAGDATSARHPPAPKTRKKPSHPYGETLPTQRPVAPPMPPPAAPSSTTSTGPLLAALYAQQHRSASAGLNSSRHSVWETEAPAAAAAAAPAVQHLPAAATSEFFDMGPEKEALLALLQESTRRPAAGGGSTGLHAQSPPHEQGVAPPTAAPAPAAATQPAKPFTSSRSPWDAHGDVASMQADLTKVPDPTSPTSPCRLSATGHGVGVLPGVSSVAGGPQPQQSRTTPTTAESGAPQLQRQCDEAQAKAEALARHLVKAITDRKLLQSNVEELEQLVEECNAEVGRLQHIVEEQHQDASTSLGVQAALRAKEREVAVYEDEIRRLNGVLEDHLARASTTQQRLQQGVSQSLVTKEAEVEAAMAEVGMAHLAQQEAEERAGQLANELETAVEQIQFLDERLAEMERAAAAAQFEKANAHLRGCGDSSSVLAVDSAAFSATSLPLALPSAEETRTWPVEARRAMAQMVAQAQGLLQQNAESERHAAMRLQHVEHTCTELQQHLRRRDEEVERARQACQQLAREKSVLQACGEQWHQQLQEVKEDAQLVSEMMRTARDDAEEVYITSRVAEERVVEQKAAAAAASPFRTAPAPPSPLPVEVGTLQKTARFAQQVMNDFHAVARFLSSLRSMEIGDRNGYQILQSIATGRSPAEGLFITADDAATPKRLREQLSPDATTEARRRVKEKKARVLRAVERALKLEETQVVVAPLPLQSSRSGSSTVRSDPTRDASPPVVIQLGLPPRAETERVAVVTEVVTAPLTPAAEIDVEEEPDAFVDDVADAFEPEVEVAASALQPARLGSYSYRGGSNGMVHSDLRREPAESGFTGSHNSSQATPLISQSASATTRFATVTAAPPPVPVPPLAPPAVVIVPPIPTTSLQQQQQRRPSLTRSPRTPVPLAASGVPVCSALFMGDAAEQPSSATAPPTAAATAAAAAASPQTPPPPPSVSRPLRLSASPSQPQSDAREEWADKKTSAVAPPSATGGDAEDMATADRLDVLSTPLQEKKARVHRDASTITVVSSPSLSLQASEWLTSPPQSQQPPSRTELSTDSETPAPSFSTAAAAGDATSSAQQSPPPAEKDTLSSLVAPASGVVSRAQAVEGEAASVQRQSTPDRPPPQRPSMQLRSPSQDEDAPPPTHTRLRSPTPDRAPRPSLDVVTSPLGPPPRPSLNSVDEPPPRAVREDSTPSRIGSHPKARSTTARPPSTPPGASLRSAASTAQHDGDSKTSAQGRAGVRRAASEQSNNDDEATLFFREPARGVVHEVASPESNSHHEDVAGEVDAEEERVEVDLLQDDFVMPSSKIVAAAPTATLTHAAVVQKAEDKVVIAPPPPPPLLPPPRSPTAASEQNTKDAELPSAPSAVAAQQPPHSAPDGSEKSGAKTKEERLRSPRSRRVVDADDDDDEPSLQFAAPPLPPPHPAAFPHPLSAELAEADGAPHALSSSSVSPTDPDAPKWPSHRPLHQPRRPQPSDAAPSLSTARSTGSISGGGVAPPRLQRSTSPSPSSSATLVGPPVPLSSRSEASKPRRASSASRDRAVPDATPTLAEPQRAAPASRPEPTMSAAAAPEVTVVHDAPLPSQPIRAAAAARASRSSSSDAVVEEVREAVEAAEEEDEVVSELVVRSGTATPHRGASRVPVAVVAEQVAEDEEDAEPVLRRSGSKASVLSQPQQTPGRLLSSGAATATPGSPPESEAAHLEPQLPQQPPMVYTAPVAPASSGIGLPHAMRSDTVEQTSMSLSQPADPLPAAPGRPREQDRGDRSSSSGATTPRRAARSGGGGAGSCSSSGPAPLPTINADAPESNTLSLRRASPTPLPSATAPPAPLTHQSSTPVVTEAVSSLPSSPRSRSGPSGARTPSNSSFTTSPRPETASAARRRDDVTRILERIRAKREQEQERRSGTATPTVATARSPSSSSPLGSDNPSFLVE